MSRLTRRSKYFLNMNEWVDKVSGASNCVRLLKVLRWVKVANFLLTRPLFNVHINFIVTVYS